MSTVATPSAAVAAQQADLELVQALMGGTRAMREAGERYLPRWPNEDVRAHRARVECAVLFPAYDRTVSTLASKPFSKPITIGEDVPARIRAWCENIDLQGRNLHVFCSDVFRHALGEGLAGILVEYPRADGVRTRADERARNLRPYFVAVRKADILGWRSAVVDGQHVITQLRIRETVSEDDGEFGERKIEQVRVLTPGAWATYRKAKGGEWAPHESGTSTLPVVPFVPVYGKRASFMLGEPPLMNVAHMNVQHWQDSSDQQKSVRFARVRIAAIVGGDPDAELTVGADYFMRLPPGASIEIAQGSAESVSIGRQELAALEEQMRQAGAELLVLQPGTITATQVRTENAVGMSVLQEIAASAQDAFDAALQIMADWIGEPQGGHVKLFDDYAAGTMAEASAQILLSANTAGKISDQTLIEEFKRRSILGPGVTFDDERERIAEQGPALGVIDANGQ